MCIVSSFHKHKFILFFPLSIKYLAMMVAVVRSTDEHEPLWCLLSFLTVYSFSEVLLSTFYLVGLKGVFALGSGSCSLRVCEGFGMMLLRIKNKTKYEHYKVLSIFVFALQFWFVYVANGRLSLGFLIVGLREIPETNCNLNRLNFIFVISV